MRAAGLTGTGTPQPCSLRSLEWLLRRVLFVLNAILDEVFELSAVLSFGALAALDKDFNDFKSLIDGKLPTVFFLAFEAIAFLSLFFG